MSRIVDEPYFTHSAYSAFTTGIQVKCPKCHGAGVVTADEDNAYFRCLSCGHRMTQDRTVYRYDVHNQSITPMSSSLRPQCSSPLTRTTTRPWKR